MLAVARRGGGLEQEQSIQEQQEQLALSCVMARSHDIRDGTAGGAFFF